MERKNLMSARNCRLLRLLIVVLAAVMIGNSQSLLRVQAQKPRQRQPQPPVIPKSPQTLDDLFAAVARQVPEFGGLFLSSDDQTLQVYLTDTSKEKVEAVKKAIVGDFGTTVMPKGGIRVLQGQYVFLQLKEWYDRMLGPIFSTGGVTFADIDEAKNRLRIGIDKREVTTRVIEQLGKLRIPREAVVMDVIGLIVPSKPAGGDRPASITLQNKLRPTQGGYQIIKNDGYGGACTLCFNALRGNDSGFVTSAWCTNNVWQPDGMSFFQAGPFDVVGAETVDPLGFLSPTYPCQKYQRCRWSAGAFVKYDPGITSAQGVIARTTGLTTTATPILTVASTKFGIAAAPSQPYLVGLSLNKVGRMTGWTNGQITSTCATWSFAPNNLLLCQYTVSNMQIATIAHFTDSGAPVFRLRNFSYQGWDHVELYGMLWGVVTGGQQFVFSPIGGVPFQQTGIQSPTDLGPLDYVNCAMPPGPPRC